MADADVSRPSEPLGGPQENTGHTATRVSLLIKDFEQELMTMLVARLNMCAEMVAADCVRRMVLLQQEIFQNDEILGNEIVPEIKSNTSFPTNPPWKRDLTRDPAKLSFAQFCKLKQEFCEFSSNGNTSRTSTTPLSMSASRSATGSRSRRTARDGRSSSGSQKNSRAGSSCRSSSRRNRQYHGRASPFRFQTKRAKQWISWATKLKSTTRSDRGRPPTLQAEPSTWQGGGALETQEKGTLSEMASSSTKVPDSTTPSHGRKEDAPPSAPPVTGSQDRSPSAPIMTGTWSSWKKSVDHGQRQSLNIAFPINQPGADFSESDSDSISTSDDSNIGKEDARPLSPSHSSRE
eukprot:gnl/MRDRNA2_/MRDRNA2_150391_c0_seq1.p1 gnl/MRDRNA2_/MRDRNA2_150391_c0~~gnl/MRDRNA2_/MRDRNA2_150391_c0_seq1.p1  ORF type:complete len:349 (-),score=36.48 gnl/MRDRNA2_/MRDRNA2_150391_c0_seq1:324-1370(-)